jgi:hypothetical protein
VKVVGLKKYEDVQNKVSQSRPRSNEI